MTAADPIYDVAIIGGGINGAGIARDAAGRGLKVLLAEKDDLASHTSSWSTKLIHGGLRYLEHYEFRLVAESLAEREVLLRIAPHLVTPMSFVLPHEPHLRPRWMIRAGLFLYDHLGRGRTLPRSFSTRLRAAPWGVGLKPRFENGFVYADARVDDARLVLSNAVSARDLGADIRTRTAVTAARRDGGRWRVTLEGADGPGTVEARVLVNAAGPWVKSVLEAMDPGAVGAHVRHVKGSHIVVPRLHEGAHAFILQNADKRVVFVIPFEERYSLIGTTDVPTAEYAHPAISDDEVRYLCDITNAYLAKPIAPQDVVWTYSGVRPLFDDGTDDPSAVTRDYVIRTSTGENGSAPLVSVFGGKITTYRRLAEHVLAEVSTSFPAMRGPWSHAKALPGGALPPGGLERYRRELAGQYAGLPPALVGAWVARHGSDAHQLLKGFQRSEDLGEHFGGTLYEAEIHHMVRNEWARTAEDVLWRRTKCGLALTPAARGRVEEYISRQTAVAPA